MTDHRNEAVYRYLTGGRSPRTEPRGWLASLTVVVGATGSVSAAARALDVPRRTMRRWLAGEGQPDSGRRDIVMNAVARATRRDRMPAPRERRVRAAKTITITGVDRYDDAPRTVTFKLGGGTTGLRAGALDRVVDAYLAGGEATDGGSQMGRGLFAIIADSMQDSWYQRFFHSDAPDNGNDIERITIK